MASAQNTETAKLLKKIFDHVSKRVWKERKEAEKKKKAADEGTEGGDHLDVGGKAKAILGKGFGYANRGSKFIAAQDGRGVYKNFSHIAGDSVLMANFAYAKFPDGPKHNFSPNLFNQSNNKKAGQRYPYSWEAHHLLPGSAFYYESDGKPIFTYQQYRLLLQTEYDINHGHNIIMLPRSAQFVPVHALIQHAGDHPKYTNRVMKDLEGIADSIQKLVDKNKPHKKIADSFFNKLKNLEEDYWDLLVALGRKLYTANKAAINDDIVKYESNSKKTKYEWGALI